MTIYKQTNVTAKTGVNFIRTVVEAAGSLFHKIEQENDLGVDALVELVRDERPLNKQVALQIKSGQSYYDASSEECLIPIGGHRDYWANYPLPVLGVVYVPSLDRAHWVDIKNHLKRFPDTNTIRFLSSEANRLDGLSFERVFVPAVLREVPSLLFDEAYKLFQSHKMDEVYLGLIVLFRRYANDIRVWDALVSHFVERPTEEIPGVLVSFLAHIPWHPDIFYRGERISEATRSYARELLHRFGCTELIKLISFIDEETVISRGSFGQSVEAIISSLPNVERLLDDIAREPRQAMFIRERAALILAMNVGRDALPILVNLAEAGSWYAGELARHVDEYGAINPYA